MNNYGYLLITQKSTCATLQKASCAFQQKSSILLLIRFNSSCKVVLWDQFFWALQDCLNKTSITCFFSILISMHFLWESMEGCWMLSCIAVRIPLSGQSVSTVPILSSTHMLVWRIGFGSSDKNFCSSKISLFS